MRGLLLPALILIVLAGLATVAIRSLELDYRIDAFLPAPADADQALVVDQLGSGPGGRMILAAIDGASPARLAQVSHELAGQWRGLDGVVQVQNGSDVPDPATLEKLMQARFVLIDRIEDRTEPDAITDQLDDRLSELAMGGRQVEQLIRRDPLGLIPELADRLAPASSPQRFDGAWFDPAMERALLIVSSEYPAFASQDQRILVDNLRAAFAEQADAEMSLKLAGPAMIGLDSAERSRGDATRLSLIGSVFLLLILTVVWRSPALVLAGALPLAAGAVCGLAATVVFFGQVHGLTLAFGFTLLGVVLDYPVHLFGHASGRRLNQSARDIAAPLLLGATSTLIAYLAIWTSTSQGLAQLGAFSAAGLAGAALTTLLLPWLNISAPDRLPRRVPTVVYQPWIVGLAALIAVGTLFWQGEDRWSADLSRLSPISPERIADDVDLRRALGAGDVGQLIVINVSTLDQALQTSEHTVEILESARQQGLLDNWQSPSDLIPSTAEQARRRSAWPSPESLSLAISEAAPRFQAEAFGPFMDDLAGLGDLPNLTPEWWADTALADRVNSLLTPTDDGWRALIVPVGLSDPDALSGLLEQHQAAARLIDMRAVSEAMVTAYRIEAGWSLAIAAMLIVVLLAVRLGRLGTTLRVIAPPLAAVACTAAIMSVFDQGLTIVHLVGLLLAAGIGLDFAIFTQTLADRPEQRQRTNRSVLVCAVTSGGVFLILGQSGIGTLNMLGLTVALGILLSWIFARLCQPPCRYR